MKSTILTLTLWLWCLGMVAYAQQDLITVNDVRDERTHLYLFTHATIHQDYQTVLTDASMLVKDGKVVSISSGTIEAPAGAIVVDLEGKYIYPSFIDLHTHYGVSGKPKPGRFNWRGPEKIGPQKEGAFGANDAIKSYVHAEDQFKVNKSAAKAMRQKGFGTVLSSSWDGLARGTGLLAVLSDEEAYDALIKTRVSAHFSFDKGSSSQMYPVSDMGMVAVLRQTHYDAEWYAHQDHDEYYDMALKAYNEELSLPKFFVADTKMDILRAAKMGKELGMDYVMIGGADAYQRTDAIKKTGSTLVIPLNFPKAFDIQDPFEASQVSLKQLMHWEQAPANPARLVEAGIPFAITSEGVKSDKTFWTNLRKAHTYGLSEQEALKALTYTPARLVHAEKEVGALQKGMLANFFIASGDIFEEDTELYENWVKGHKYVVKDMKIADYSGNYSLKVGDSTFLLQIKGKEKGVKLTVTTKDSTKLKSKGDLTEQTLSLAFSTDSTGVQRWSLSGWPKGEGWEGKAVDEIGTWTTFVATLESKPEEEEKKADKEDSVNIPEVIYPFVAYGQEQYPEQENIVFKNATVWTNEAEGIMTHADVWIKAGKIMAVGKDLAAKGAKVIDATGKHLTSGVIDEHSHIALYSVNDLATVSSMVRMADVINPEDINIYRQLSGGVTASQLLHGSANPVGGQSAIVKLRWGQTPEEMLIKGADPFIKFALGENVKRSYNPSSIRYPQTRMGVEQVYRDFFARAKAYDTAWRKYNGLSAKAQKSADRPRRDLALEAMAEIVNSERFITCHSYVQSEINMLMHVADDFGFKVNTFTHILEGYKVADKMAAHGAGGSTFADWWAYKFEVRYAIPYNASLMAMEGVTVAINSDDPEMARRLNQEAAKSVKYGGMSEEDAWKMVTLNPAKLLHLDHRMGSLKAGKDADLVLWSDNPLSIYARAEKTLVDGRVLYDLEKDAALRKKIAQEKQRILAKMHQAAEKGESTQPVSFMLQRHFHCDDLDTDIEAYSDEHNQAH